MPPLSRRPGRFPVATIAAYGPNASLATKLVVSVVRRPGGQPAASRSWTTTAADVRNDVAIAEDVTLFLREQRVADTVTSDRIIGCPHQEGIDYPLGRVCPRCPFWARIDRFTHEPIVIPQPTMSVSEVLSALTATRSTQPREALVSADGHRDALVEPLLTALDRGITDPTGASEQEANLFSYALYLLAKWRETRAYPHVCRWLSLPGDGPFDIAGDIVGQDGARILASVYDGNLEPITSLATNMAANDYGRRAAISALARLAAWAEVPRERMVDVFLWLAREGLEREPSEIWAGLAGECLDIHLAEAYPEIRRAFEEGLIDEQSVAPSELEAAEREPPVDRLEETRPGYLPIDDVAQATAWWNAFEDERRAARRQQPLRSSSKAGRNDPCPCGSGKKYKKCCGR